MIEMGGQNSSILLPISCPIVETYKKNHLYRIGIGKELGLSRRNGTMKYLQVEQNKCKAKMMMERGPYSVYHKQEMHV